MSVSFESATGNYSCGGVLVVEDDADIRDALRDALADEGYVVETAANGRLGMDTLRRGDRPYFVILDMMMPVLDGTGFLRELGADSTLSRHVVLVASAAAPSAPVGVVGVLHKPIELDALLAWVGRYCARENS